MTDAILVDTGILLRLFERKDSRRNILRKLLFEYTQSHTRLVTSFQNIAEFWNVSTRPTDIRGGYHRSAKETYRRLKLLSRYFEIITETPISYQLWQHMLMEHDIIGVAVHDARLVALMRSFGIQHLLTLNDSDFRRYKDINLIFPGEGKLH